MAGKPITSGKTGRTRRPAQGSTVERNELPAILQSLGDEHKYQARLLNVLEKQVGLLNQRQTPDYAMMRGVMRYMTQFPDRYHHPKEDLLFEKIVLRDAGARAAVDELLEAHTSIIDKGSRLLQLIDQRLNGAADGDDHVLRKAAHAYIGTLRRHMDIEWLHLFPRALEVLQPEDWRDVDAKMKPILDPVFGATVSTEFQSLHDESTAKTEPEPPGRLGVGLIEAAALIESVASVIIGLTKIRQDLTRHNQAAIRANNELVRELIRLMPMDDRVRMLGEVCERNVAMFSDINARMVNLWSDMWAAARRPYEDDGPYAPKLLKPLRRRAAAASPEDS